MLTLWRITYMFLHCLFCLVLVTWEIAIGFAMAFVCVLCAVCSTSRIKTLKKLFGHTTIAKTFQSCSQTRLQTERWLVTCNRQYFCKTLLCHSWTVILCHTNVFLKQEIFYRLWHRFQTKGEVWYLDLGLQPNNINDDTQCFIYHKTQKVPFMLPTFVKTMHQKYLPKDVCSKWSTAHKQYIILKVMHKVDWIGRILETHSCYVQHD